MGQPSKRTKMWHRAWKHSSGRSMPLKTWAAEEAGEEDPPPDPAIIEWCKNKGILPIPF